MAAENTPIGVEFVDNDVRQIFEEPSPLRVMREYTLVQHVRVCEHHMAFRADSRAGILWRVAVIRVHPEVPFECVSPGHEVIELVVRQRFRRVKVKSAGIRINCNALKYRKVVAKRLPGSRRGDDSDVLSSF
jgi:hypothetical protein